jgi:tryptophanyl-tRNA synthetase
MTKPRVFSGIQPSGSIHIGNYLGAVRRWVEEQDKYYNLYCIVDLHSITVPQDPALLRQNTRELAAILLAAGISPIKSMLFVQSHIAEHAELGWIINCVTPMGWLQRMTQFKEKSHRQRETVSVGLFAYPTLMAADILLYQTDLVPVGDDQKQHVELARDVAQRFNHTYGDVFVVPEAHISPTASRVMGLDDPTRKMSKSTDGENHSVGVLDKPDIIRRKIMHATTDSLRDVRFDPERPGIYNLLSIYEGFTGLSRDVIESRFRAKGYGDLKRGVAEVIIETLRPLQERYHQLMADVESLDRLLSECAESVRPIASETLDRAFSSMGLR